MKKFFIFIIILSFYTNLYAKKVIDVRKKINKKSPIPKTYKLNEIDFSGRVLPSPAMTNNPEKWYKQWQKNTGEKLRKTSGIRETLKKEMKKRGRKFVVIGGMPGKKKKRKKSYNENLVKIGEKKYKVKVKDIEIVKVIPKKGNNPLNQEEPVNNTFVNNKVVYIPPDEINKPESKCSPLSYTASKVGLFLSENRCGLGIADGFEGVLFKVINSKIVMNMGKKFVFIEGNINLSSPPNPFYGSYYYLKPGNLYSFKVKDFNTGKIWIVKTKVYIHGNNVNVQIIEIN